MRVGVLLLGAGELALEPGELRAQLLQTGFWVTLCPPALAGFMCASCAVSEEICASACCFSSWIALILASIAPAALTVLVVCVLRSAMLCEVSYLLRLLSARSRRRCAIGSCLERKSSALLAWPETSSASRATNTAAKSLAILAAVCGSPQVTLSASTLVLVTGLTLTALLSVRTSVFRSRSSMTRCTTGVSLICSA